MKKFYLFLTLFMAVCFCPGVLFATDNAIVLGGVASTGQLRINVNAGGNYCVYRYFNSNWYKQFYATNSHLFAIKIGSTTFASGGTTMPSAGSITSGSVTAFTTIADVASSISGTAHYMTKKFTGSYSGYSFSVTITIRYNTSSMDYLVKEAVLDMSNIPSGTAISFAYGWDTYVNTSDAGFAYIVPDNSNYNGMSTVTNYDFTTTQVRALRLVGAKNNTGTGAVIGFFPMGRNFDRAYSASSYNPAHAFNMVSLTTNRFQFGPYTSGNDNGTGVAYDNITAGAITSINTGLTFSPDLKGELDYTWSGSKNYVAVLGTNINLNLTYKSLSNAALSGIAFRINFPGLPIRTTGSASGFSGGTHTWTVGNEYYQFTNGSIAALGTGTITVPVNVTQAGQWVIDANSITNTANTTPLGTPATLTVTTTAALSSSTAVNTCGGTSNTFTVKYPGSQTAAQAVTINLTYSGATGDFTTRPSTVTIPAGANSATFAVTAAASPTGTSNMTITLSSTNKAFVSIGSPASVNIRAYPPLTAGAIGTAKSICSNTSPGTLTQTTAPTGGTGTYSFQWQSSTNGSSWTNISGANASTYTPGNLTANTYFRRNVTSGSCGTVSSASILISIYANPTAGAIGSAQTICYNTAPAAFTQTTAPTGGNGTYSYQWQYSTDGSSWTNISGANAATYTSPALTASRYFRRAVTSCSTTVYSASVLVTVRANLTSGAIGTAQTICYNTAPAAFTETTAPTGGTGTYTYQWQYSTDGSTWTNISGATAATYTSPALTASRSFRRAVTSNPCGTVYSSPISVTVLPNLTAGAIGSAQTICYNTAPAAFTQTTAPSGGTGTYTFQWQYSTDGSNWTNISNATASTYTSPALTASRSFRRAVTSGTCTTVYSTPVQITVYANLTAGAIGSAQTICYNTAPAAFTQTTAPAGGTGTYSFQWQYSTDGSSWTNISNATASTYTPSALTATTYFRRNVTSGSCGTVSSTSVQITVYANLTSGAIGSAQTICYNTAPAALTQTTAPSGGTGTYTFQWQSSPNGSSWTNISNATASTYTPSALTATTYFRRNVTSGSCGTVSSTSVQITVYANLTAGAIGTAQSICYNTAPAAFTQTTAPAGGTGTYSFQWQYSTDGSNWTNISNATAATYTSGVLTANRYFRRAVTSTPCGTVYSTSILITVNALPAAPTGGTPAIVCINTAASATATPPSGCTIDWYAAATGGTAIATGNNTLSIASLAATTTYYAESRNTTTGCKSATRTAFTITVSPCVVPVNPHLRSRAGN